MISRVCNAPGVQETPFEAPPGQEESLDRMADAVRYNAWLFGRAEPFLGARTLDLGAGVGTFTELLAERGEVVALEPDREFIPVLERRFAEQPRVTVVNGDVSMLPTLGRFDSVLCFNVIEHIPDDRAAFRAIADVLRPGGHALVLVPAHQALFGEIDRSVGHERRYGRRLVLERLRTAGLAPVVVRYVNPVGAVGWFMSARVLRRNQVPEGPLKIYDSLVPVLRSLDRLRLPFGLSVWAVGRKA